MKNIIKLIASILVIVIAISVLFFVNSVKYNDGICSECGHQLSFAGASPARTYGNRHLARYFYTCENCGHVVETSFIMK